MDFRNKGMPSEFQHSAAA